MFLLFFLKRRIHLPNLSSSTDLVVALIIIGQDTRAFSACTRTLVCLCQLTWELEEEEANRVPSITFQVKSSARMESCDISQEDYAGNRGQYSTILVIIIINILNPDWAPNEVGQIGLVVLVVASVFR